jgi:hypothetical protein
VSAPVRLCQRTLNVASWAAGEWLEKEMICDVETAVALRHETGIYILGDRRGSILHLGKACRDDGIAGRIREHLRHPVRRKTTTVGLVLLDEWTPPAVIAVIEGKAAERLRLKQQLPNDRWPKTDNWAALVSSRSVPA